MTVPLKILMIVPTSFFSDYGGHIRILEESYALQKLGHQIKLVTYYKGADVAGLDIERTAVLPWHTDYEVGSSRHKIIFDLYLMLRSLAVAFSFRPDVIHGHMHEGALIGAVLSRIWRIPLIFDFQGSLTGEMVDHRFLREGSLIHKGMWWLEKKICHFSDKILTSSQQATQLLKEQFLVPQERLQPLPDCVDLNRFNQADYSAEVKQQLRARLGIAENIKIVVYLGLLAEYQGTVHLIEAAVRLKKLGTPIHFLIMGYPDVEKYRALAAKKGVTDIVTFTGRIPYGEAPYYLSLGDIAVSPKLSLTEGSGKVLNYMGMKLPIVAYKTAVHQEYLGGSGRYAEIGNVSQFVEQIERLIHNKAEGQRLGEELYQRAKQEFSWERAGKLIEQVYYQLKLDKEI